MRAFRVLSASAVAVAAHDTTFMQLSVPLPEDKLYNSLFNDFKSKFNRDYASSEEESQRKHIFIANMIRAREMDKLDNNSVPFGHLSPFADWSKQEFEKYTNRGIISDGKPESILNTLRAKVSNIFHLNEEKPNESPVPSQADMMKHLDSIPTVYPKFGEGALSAYTSAPDSYDWREKGAVNPVKNQGQCGSCWSFSTVANIEGAAVAENLGALQSLSEQQLVDCDKSDNGCDGGLPEQADKWLIATKNGLELEKDYPYEGIAGKCREKSSRERIFVGSFVHVGMDETAIAAALVQYGPLSIGINANQMQMYMGGVAQPTKDACDPEQLNHGVALVGYGSENTPSNPQAIKELQRIHYQYKSLGLIQKLPKLSVGDEPGEATPFWVIRNSWGPEWGEKGYYRIIRGQGACGMNQLVTGATDLKNHPKVPAVEDKPAADVAVVEEVKENEAKLTSEVFV